MQTITKQVISELDVLFGLYQLALDYTDKIEGHSQENVQKGLDVRQRIIGKTAPCAKAAANLLKVFACAQNIPANERALVEEKRQMVKDTVSIMQRKEFGLMTGLAKNMKFIRAELAGINKKQIAAKAYIQAPRAAALSY